MGKGRPRAVEKGVLGGHCSGGASPSETTTVLNIPQAPVYYPTEEEFKDPLEFIDKIRPEAESYGICRIVPPESWKPPFALNPDSFTFPTKSQAIHQLQARPAPCDPRTFELEYNRFLQDHCGRKPKKRAAVVFQGEELDLCRLFNAVKRFGGYDKVVKEKKWADVFRFVRSEVKQKVTECAKHVLCGLYREHLYDYELYHCGLRLDQGKNKFKRRRGGRVSKNGNDMPGLECKRPRKNVQEERVKEEEENEKEKEKELDQICEQCRSGLHGDVMLLCDRCNKGWHLYCLSPPLEQVPSGNWYCLECVNSDKDSFGFVPGKRFSLEAFRKMAERAKKKWFGAGVLSRAQIEKRFWEIVEGSLGEVEVMYGSDLDTSLYGSGFPRANDPLPASVEAEVWNKYCTSPWNLNNLPKLPGSMLREVHDNIAGVMVPWLYVGMLFSSFCWHFEDHCFYSMNYLHWGEPKCWYSVPGGEARDFEKVMRKTLPDLFETQPDLLFQLVTMLNPSVLQENGVSVYGVLQEPGNFVITFPRSFHGGFNFGLNCAEAVNFAPADWLPHGGSGAELYRLYHKPAVISHEELLCVVAKGSCNSKVTPYLEEELRRIYEKEKTYRENLWRNGIVKASLMSPRIHPEYVGTEEDPTCIICRQYLYLSAVSCSCQPSAFVCLEHWEHLCECNLSKHCLLYRHTLAELYDLVLMVNPASTTAWTLEETVQRRIHCGHLSCYESNGLMKKVKGAQVSHLQLAEDWILSSRKLLQTPCSNSAYISALKGAQHFLWAGHEMDMVRVVAHDLVKAKKWSADVRNCLSKVDTWVHSQDSEIEKVSLNHVENLLSFDPLPCNEPGYLRLKALADEARVLVSEIKSALSSSSCVTIAGLESLYSKAINFPIFLEECERLGKEISSAKVLIESANRCFSVQPPPSIELDVLNKLTSEMSELCLQLPELEMLSALTRKAESWKIRCCKFLEGPITLKEIEFFLQDVDTFTVRVPEFNLLRQYHSDALSLICRFHELLVNIQERKDYSKVVNELACILKDGELLRVQVDELPLIKAELRKSCCREKASKVLASRMALELIEQLMTEAASLQIENEKLFCDVSEVLLSSYSWEERAKHILTNGGQMLDFEEAMRASQNIFAILPSLHDVRDALSMAETWLRRSQPFLMSTVSSGLSSSPLLKVDALKELVTQSKCMKVSLRAPDMLLRILKNVEAWEHGAASLLEHADSLYNVDTIIDDRLTFSIKDSLSRIDCAVQAGISLGFELCALSKLQNVSSILHWSLEVLYCSSAPFLKEVDCLIKSGDSLPPLPSLKSFKGALVDGLRWLRQALMAIPDSCNSRNPKLKDVKEVLEEAQKIKIPIPSMVARLENAIEKHMLWQKQVHEFFNSKQGENSWSSLLLLQKQGLSNALDCPELDMVESEIEKVEKWIVRCKDIVGSSVGDLCSLSSALVMIRDTLDRAVSTHLSLKNCAVRDCCTFCFGDCEDEMFTCVKCKDRYHLSCVGPVFCNAGVGKAQKCAFCLCIESSIISENGNWPLLSRRKRPTLEMFVELMHDGENFCACRIEERDMVQKIVEKSLICKSYITDIVSCTSVSCEKELSRVSESLLIALKAMVLAGVYDSEDSQKIKSALTRNSWRIKAKKLLEGSRKPHIQEIQCILKEGLAINMSLQDHFMQKLSEEKCMSLQWANLAKKVAFDSGELELDRVFDLIIEGENLPIHFEKELKLLRDRSVLYCICRKPYDHRAMIACDQCDEWYHFKCINLLEPPPKTFICPACEPLTIDSMLLSPSIHNEERSSTDIEPQTTPPPFKEPKRRQHGNAKSSLQQKILAVADLISILRNSSETDFLWRKSRKPLSRTARKRRKFENLLPFIH